MKKTNSFEQVIANGATAYYMWLAEMTCDENCAKCAFNDGDICYSECNDTYEEIEILRLENEIMHSSTELLRLANQSRERELKLLDIEWDLIQLRVEYNL